MSKVRVLDHDAWITTISGYDDKARVVYTASKNNYLNTTDISESNIDFAGKVLESKSSHTRASNAPVITNEYFTYDHMARPLTHQQAINANPWTTLSSLEYDKIGQNTIKYVGDSIQTVDFKYNVRGWLKSINDPNNLGDDLFGFAISYNDPANGAQGLLNGNISGTSWKTANDNVLRFYNYTYDALNRIKVAGYNNENGDEPGWFNVTNINYDKNGNLLTLNRAKKGSPTAGAAMDYLTYSYGNSSNKLTRVEDQYDNAGGFENGTNTGDDYAYDSNGNMLSDANKGITDITYNHLNLPTSVSINGGIINYVYDASGVKLEKTTSSGSYREYNSNYIYENGVLQFFFNSEGYSVNNNGQFTYTFKYTDHLDNIRVLYSDINQNGGIETSSEIFKEINYYPNGLTHAGYNNSVSSSSNSTVNGFLFIGKEIQTDYDIEWYDFGARNFDPSLGRWMNIDPLAEDMRRHSPFNYSFNNPIYFMDPDGMSPCPNGCPPPAIPMNPEEAALFEMNGAYNKPIPIGDGSNSSMAKIENPVEQKNEINQAKKNTTDQSQKKSNFKWFGHVTTVGETETITLSVDPSDKFADKVFVSAFIGTKSGESGMFNTISRTDQNGTSYGLQMNGLTRGSVSVYGTKNGGFGFALSGGFANYDAEYLSGFDNYIMPTTQYGVTGTTSSGTVINARGGYSLGKYTAIIATSAVSIGTLVTRLGPGAIPAGAY